MKNHKYKKNSLENDCNDLLPILVMDGQKSTQVLIKTEVCSEEITNNSIRFKMIFIDSPSDRDIYLISDRQSFLCLDWFKLMT